MINRGLNLEELKTRKFETEDQFQAASIDLAHNHFPEFNSKIFHTPNEQHIPKWLNESERDYKKRGQYIGNLNKRKGKLAGVPDIIIRYKGIMFCIELKLEKERNTKNGGLGDEQVKIHNVWALDCPEIPPFKAYNLYEVYMIFCWVLRQNFHVVRP